MLFGSSHTAVRSPVNNNLFFIKSVSGISCQVQYCSSLTAVNEGTSSYNIIQGGRTWQAFCGGKNGHETFRQAHIYNFRDKCVAFARNLKFSNLTQ